jgi:hypothetical protein
LPKIPESIMRSLASRGLASALLFALTACSAARDAGIGAPTDPLFGKGKPSSGSAAPAMSISPTSMTISVGGSTAVSVTYRDSKGNIIPDTNMRLTYYGCFPVAPAGTTCNDLLTITPVMPYLRQAILAGVGAGQARIYASDGMGTYVYADLIIQ